MTKGKTIAIIDDDEFLLDMYATKLQKVGYDVLTYKTGVEALRDLPKKKAALILLDIVMPEMDGIDVLQQLKQNEQTKKTPVILLTNLDDEKVRKKGAEGGALYFLNKAAYLPREVTAIIDDILEE